MKYYYILFLTLILSTALAQENQKVYHIIDAVSSENIKQDIEKLVSFGTRHTLSDTLSKSRGIGAARRWIKSEFDKISNTCDGCLKVFYQKNYFTPEDGDRIVKPVWINNVVAIQLSLIHISEPTRPY